MFTRLTIVFTSLLLAGTALPINAGARPGPASLYRVLPSGALAGMPPVTIPGNIYSETGAGHLSSNTAGALDRIYVPEHGGNSVSVIDPATLKVVDQFKVGSNPQHAVPSWDLKTIWITNNSDVRAGNGSMTPIDPTTGKPGPNIPVIDPYNLYFMPNGSSAIVVNEAARRLDFRDPHTMDFKFTIPVPECAGINHADFSADGTYAIFSCEFGGGVVKIDLVNYDVAGRLKLSLHVPTPPVVIESGGKRRAEQLRRRLRRVRARGQAIMTHANMPQDVRLSPDGKVFYVADMMADGVFLIDGDTLAETGFIPTGPGAHGFCISRDGKTLYVANRGSHDMPTGHPGGPGSVSLIDFETSKVIANWSIPGGGSPDMGNVSADGRQLWFSGRFDNVVYMFDTASGTVSKIPVGHEPHGLTVWPQPGRYSLGHTGNLR